MRTVSTNPLRSVRGLQQQHFSLQSIFPTLFPVLSPLRLFSFVFTAESTGFHQFLPNHNLTTSVSKTRENHIRTTQNIGNMIRNMCINPSISNIPTLKLLFVPKQNPKQYVKLKHLTKTQISNKVKSKSRNHQAQRFPKTYIIQKIDQSRYFN